MAQLIGTEHGVRYIEVTPAYASTTVTYLLLHGLGGSLEQWSSVIELMGADARTIAIDIPGFGKSRTLRGNFDLEMAADKILKFCDTKGVASGILVSHSVGCVVAARLATAAPDMFMRIIFVSGTLARASEMAQDPLLALSDPRLGALVAAQFVTSALPVPHFALNAISSSRFLRHLLLWPFVAQPGEVPPGRIVDTLTESGSLSVIRILFTAKAIDYFGIISAVAQPVDLVWGSEDRLINNEDIVRARQMVNVVREHVIARCGHWPWLENPAELVNFLTSWSTDGMSPTPSA